MFHVWIAGHWDQSYLSVFPFSDQVLFGRGRKEFNWHLYWKPELAISLLKSFFYNPLSTYFCRGRPLSWRNPFLSFRKWFVRAQFSAFFKARFWGGGWDQPYFFWSAQTQSFQNHWDFLMQFKDQSFHLHTVTLLVVTNSFKIPSHRAPQIHENTSKCCPINSCLVSFE